jgi:hypothetical protein
MGRELHTIEGGGTLWHFKSFVSVRAANAPALQKVASLAVSRSCGYAISP